MVMSPSPLKPALLACVMALPAVFTGASIAAAQIVTPAPDAGVAPFEMPMAEAPAPADPGARSQDDPFRFPDSLTDRAPGDPASPLDQLMENMFRRAQPHLEGLARDMGGLMDDYAPVFEDLGRLMDDIGNYDLPPERLPNGDILIRRKAGAPPPPPLEELPNLLPRGGAAPAPGSPPLVAPLSQNPSGAVDL